jgi:hypothetical protein
MLSSKRSGQLPEAAIPPTTAVQSRPTVSRSAGRSARTRGGEESLEKNNLLMSPSSSSPYQTSAFYSQPCPSPYLRLLVLLPLLVFLITILHTIIPTIITCCENSGTERARYCCEPREMRGANPIMRKCRRGNGTIFTASLQRSQFSFTC